MTDSQAVPEGKPLPLKNASLSSAPTCPDCGQLPPCKHIAPETPEHPALAGLEDRLRDLVAKAEKLRGVPEEIDAPLPPDLWLCQRCLTLIPESDLGGKNDEGVGHDIGDDRPHYCGPCVPLEREELAGLLEELQHFRWLARRAERAPAGATWVRRLREIAEEFNGTSTTVGGARSMELRAILLDAADFLVAVKRRDDHLAGVSSEPVSERTPGACAVPCGDCATECAATCPSDLEPFAEPASPRAEPALPSACSRNDRCKRGEGHHGACRI